MSTARKPKQPTREAPRSVKEKVQAGDPRACVDETQPASKSPDVQRRDSRLEIGRPKDTGRCGA